MNALFNGRSHIDGLHKLLGEGENRFGVFLCHVIAVGMGSVITYPPDGIAPILSATS